MFNFVRNLFYRPFVHQVQVPISTTALYQQGELEVRVDLNPIGGYRGKVGALTIDHVTHKVFTDWSDQNLHDLAQLTQLILKIQENAQIHNTLIMTRQDDHKQFKLSFIPYPKCNWIEKIQGSLHAIFGAPHLKAEQVKEVHQFYQLQFNQNWDLSASKSKKISLIDAFCRPSVIDRQKIQDFYFQNESYHLLHDNCPKGATQTDAHLLVVPKGEAGHCDGSKVETEKRFYLLKIAQKVMKVFEQENFSTIICIERNGTALQGVQHKHQNILGIQQFPETFLAKLSALMRQLGAFRLSSDDLKLRTQHYSTYNWANI